MTQGQRRRASSWPEGGSSGSSPPKSNSKNGDARVPEYELMKSGTKSGRQRPFLLLEHLTSSNHAHSSLSICCRSLPVPINVFKHLDASFSHSKYLSQLQHRYGPLLRLRLRSLCSFKAALIPNFNKTIRHEFLIMRVQQTEDVFSILCKNFRAWLQILGLEAERYTYEEFTKYMKLDKNKIWGGGTFTCTVDRPSGSSSARLDEIEH
jgi:hypothetical protein